MEIVVMNKSQGLYQFWNNILTAYDENSVPDNAPFPYITYSTSLDDMGNEVSLTASIWDYSSSWALVSEIADRISKQLETYNRVKIDNGYIMIYKGSPFAQRMADENNMIKRIVLNVTAEFLTAY